MQTLQVQGMSCNNCVTAVQEAVKGVEPQAHVEVDLERGTVGVYGVGDLGAVAQAIENAGFEVENAPPAPEMG